MALGKGSMAAKEPSNSVGQGSTTRANAPSAPPTATASTVAGRGLGARLATERWVETFQYVIVQVGVRGQAMSTPGAGFAIQ